MSTPDYRCPVCGQESTMVIGPEQVVGSNEATCRVFFNPSLPDGGLSDATTIDLPGL